MTFAGCFETKCWRISINSGLVFCEIYNIDRKGKGLYNQNIHKRRVKPRKNSEKCF